MFWLIFACHYIRKRLPHKLQQQTKSSLPPALTVAHKAQLRRMAGWWWSGEERVRSWAAGNTIRTVINISIVCMLLLLCTANAIYPWRCIHMVWFGVACCFYWNLLKHEHSATPTRLEFCSLSNLLRLALLPISHAHTHAGDAVFVLYACEFDWKFILKLYFSLHSCCIYGASINLIDYISQINKIRTAEWTSIENWFHFENFHCTLLKCGWSGPWNWVRLRYFLKIINKIKLLFIYGIHRGGKI